MAQREHNKISTWMVEDKPEADGYRRHAAVTANSAEDAMDFVRRLGGNPESAKWICYGDSERD